MSIRTRVVFNFNVLFVLVAITGFLALLAGLMPNQAVAGTSASPTGRELVLKGEFGTIKVPIPEGQSRQLPKGNQALAGEILDLNAGAKLTVKVFSGSSAESRVQREIADHAKGKGYRAFAYDLDFMGPEGLQGSTVAFRRCDVALSELRLQVLQFSHNSREFTVEIEFSGWKAGESGIQMCSETQIATFKAWAKAREQVEISFAGITLAK